TPALGRGPGRGNRPRRRLRYLRGRAGAARRHAGEGRGMSGGFPAVEANARRLQDWLRTHLEGFEGELHIARLAGGRSNPGWRLRTAARDCVLRARPGPREKLLPSAHAIEREFRVQQALADSGVPVAAVHALCEDESIVGAGFYVMDFIDGAIFR